MVDRWCPHCGDELRWTGQAWQCGRCRVAYPKFAKLRLHIRPETGRLNLPLSRPDTFVGCPAGGPQGQVASMIIMDDIEDSGETDAQAKERVSRWFEGGALVPV